MVCRAVWVGDPNPTSPLLNSARYCLTRVFAPDRMLTSPVTARRASSPPPETSGTGETVETADVGIASRYGWQAEWLY